MKRLWRRNPAADPTALIRGQVWRTLAGLWIERVTRALWPAVTVGLFTAAALGFGVQDALPPVLAAWLLVSAGVLMVLTVGAGLWQFPPPSRAEALDRIDRSLPGRPLSALADAQAIGRTDPASSAVWQAHLRRMLAVLVTARAVPARPALARQDRLALRHLALLSFALSLLFGAPSRVGEVTELALLPGRAQAVALGPSWEAWAQPPAHTGRPSLYLNDVERGTLQLPEGTRVTVRFYGQSGVMSIVESLSDRSGPDLHAMAQDFQIQRSGRLSIRGPAGRDWEITMLRDQPPLVTLIGTMERERGGMMRQGFRAQDDYGVTGGSAEIELDLNALDRRFGLAPAPDPRASIRIDLPMPVAGARTDFSESLFGDLSQHPWANMPVVIRVQVEDGAGQTGASAPARVLLPGRRFFDPMAAAVIEIRRDILWSRHNATRADQLLRAIVHRPEDAFRTDTAVPRFRAAQALLRSSLQDGLDDTARDRLAQDLWDLAILLEEGDLADARDRLRRAQERLEEAMRSGADPSEIQELMDALRDALRDYMQELARQPRERGDAPQGGQSAEITQDQIQALLDRIQELMEQGRMEEAAELMAQLQMLLENLEFVEGDGTGSGPGSDMMEGLGDTLREQRDLADDTFRQFQDQFNRALPPAARNGAPDPDAPGSAPGSADLAERQQALRDMLRDQQLQPMPGAGSAEAEAALQALEDAQRAMEEAADALREGETAGALDRQAEAIDALREGMRQMNRAMAQDARDRGISDQGQGEGGQDRSRDPLGRSPGGELGTDEAMLQGEDARRRAQDLLDELRRRSAELDRPDAELDYLRRLLDRF